MFPTLEMSAHRVQDGGGVEAEGGVEGSLRTSTGVGGWRSTSELVRVPTPDPTCV